MTPRDRAHKNHTVFLVRMNQIKAGDVAVEMGISDTTLSNIKTTKAEDVLKLLAYLGLKVVPVDRVTLKPAVFEFLTQTHQTIVERHPELLWGQDE